MLKKAIVTALNEALSQLLEAQKHIDKGIKNSPLDENDLFNPEVFIGEIEALPLSVLDDDVRDLIENLHTLIEYTNNNL